MLRGTQFVLAVLVVLAGCSSLPAAKPIGSNCSLTAAPEESGEEAGHGVLLQVFPRNGAIGPTYTGCQAVFATTREKPAVLAWLVEVIEGDPVRIWSDDKSLESQLNCHYRKGTLVAGEQKVCDESPPTLLPSKPAGCLTGKLKGTVCVYDAR